MYRDVDAQYMLMLRQQVAAQYDIITRLPKELQLDVFELLGYQNAVRLSHVNKYSNATVDPQACPTAEKEDFVYKAQYWQKHNLIRLNARASSPVHDTITNDFACFTYYRVLPYSAFSPNQTQQGGAKSGNKQYHIGHTRFCLDCGVKGGRYRPGTLITVGANESVALYHCQPPEKTSDESLPVFSGECKSLCDLRHCERLAPTVLCGGGYTNRRIFFTERRCHFHCYRC